MSELREIDYEAVVESLLYVAGDEGVKPETIAYVIDKTKEDVMALLVNLTHRYESEHSGSGRGGGGHSREERVHPAQQHQHHPRGPAGGGTDGQECHRAQHQVGAHGHLRGAGL